MLRSSGTAPAPCLMAAVGAARGLHVLIFLPLLLLLLLFHFIREQLMANKWQRDGQGTGRGWGRSGGWGGGGEFPGNSKGLGAPAAAISSTVIKAGAVPPQPPRPSPPPSAIGPASDFNHGRGFLWRAARAASCLFRLLNSSQTRRCHPSWKRSSDTAWRPPGPGLLPLPPASGSVTCMADQQTRRTPR